MKNSVCSLILTLLCITLVVLVALFGIRGTALSGVFEAKDLTSSAVLPSPLRQSPKRVPM